MQSRKQGEPADLVALRRYVARHSVYELARLADVPRTTILSWLKRGQPAAVESWLKVMEGISMDKR